MGNMIGSSWMAMSPCIMNPSECGMWKSSNYEWIHKWDELGWLKVALDKRIVVCLTSEHY